MTEPVLLINPTRQTVCHCNHPVVHKNDMQALKTKLKSLLGNNTLRLLRPFYHGLRSYVAAAYFGFPGRKMQLVGITGTKGKTTTTVFAGRILNLLNHQTGYISSAVINVGRGEFLNAYKMSSLDSQIMHKLLAQMAQNGCRTAIIEMTSQGLEQNRHFGLGGFEITGFLNIYPEHLEAHGGWEKYKQAKGILFQNLKPEGWFVANTSCEEYKFMWNQVKHPAKVNKRLIQPTDYQILEKPDSLFKILQVADQTVQTQLLSDFDVSNAYFAAHIASLVTGTDLAEVLPKLGFLQTVPGRMEFIALHQNLAEQGNISVLVDYAHEPKSIELLLETLLHWKTRGFFDTIVHVLSADGVGRDDWKKPVMGDLSYQKADYTIFTTDNYDEHDDPQQIVNLLAQNCPQDQENQKFFKIIDRKLAFLRALALAKAHPSKRFLIVSTGVGSEQGLTQPGGKMDWDERQVWKELLQFKS